MRFLITGGAGFIGSHLAEALLDTVSELEAAHDVLEEGSNTREMAIYDRAIAWLNNQNKM